MYLVSNLAVLPTIGDWPSTLRAGGKSPTELSCWVAAQALDRQSLCKQAGQSLEMVPATMARVPAESAGQHCSTPWPLSQRNQAQQPQLPHDAKVMGKVKPVLFPAQNPRSIKQCLKALGILWFRPPQFFLELMSVHLHPAAG